MQKMFLNTIIDIGEWSIRSWILKEEKPGPEEKHVTHQAEDQATKKTKRSSRDERSVSLKQFLESLPKIKSRYCRSKTNSLAEAQPRLENRRGQKALFDTGAHYWKNYKFILYRYTSTFFIVFVISLPTKLEIYYLQYNYLCIYIIYGDRTIIGFVCFVANLLNRAIDATTVSVQKRVTFRPLVGM
jgi:hypothetical protein